jgi:hypothetical protein
MRERYSASLGDIDIHKPRPQADKASRAALGHTLALPYIHAGAGTLMGGELATLRCSTPAHIRLGVCDAMISVVLHAPVGR